LIRPKTSSISKYSGVPWLSIDLKIVIIIVVVVSEKG
jgi:hypothetical protein